MVLARTSVCLDHARGRACDPHLVNQAMSPGNLILEPSERTEKFKSIMCARMRKGVVHVPLPPSSLDTWISLLPRLGSVPSLFGSWELPHGLPAHPCLLGYSDVFLLFVNKAAWPTHNSGDIAIFVALIQGS